MQVAKYFRGNCTAAIASGWCKVLKPIIGFNLTVTENDFSTRFSTDLRKTLY